MMPHTIAPIILFVVVLFSNPWAQSSKLSLHFDTAISTLSKSEMEQLDSLKMGIQSGEVRVLAIYGYADTSGSEEYNMELSYKRAQHVRDYLKLPETTKLEGRGEPRSARSPLYADSIFRRCDILYRFTPLTPEAKALKRTMEEFLATKSDSTFVYDLQILFYPGENRMLPTSQPEIQELARIMRDYPSLKVEIHGHVCCGPNMKLSVERAQSVMTYLTSHDIQTDRLKVFGHSNELPKVEQELTEDDKRQNRRVSLVFSH